MMVMLKSMWPSLSCFFVILFHYSVCDIQFASPYNGRKIVGILGASVTFTWTFNGGDVSVVQWGTKTDGAVVAIKDSLVQIDKLLTVTKTTNPPYSGRVSGVWNGSSPGQVTFTLNSIQKADERLYVCLISPLILGDPDAVDTVELLVFETPSITDTFAVNKNFSEGDAVNISCTVTGKPNPSVFWIRSEHRSMKSFGSGTAYLTFSNVRRSDSGKYVCKANNSVGSTEKELNLRVNYKPEGTTLTTSAAQSTVTQGGTVTFTCHVTGAQPPVSQYKFFLNDTHVKTVNERQYTINNVNRSQHYGKYKCVPRNDVGDGPEATVTLNVNVPVQITVLPQNVTVNKTTPIFLSCDATGFPEPFITWTKFGQDYSDKKQLNIPSSDKSDAGEYMCTASNGVGQPKTAKVYVTVQYSPTIEKVTASPNKSWIGETVTLTCVSDGVPTPTLTWYNPGQGEIRRVKGHENTVQVKMEGDQYFGYYKCSAANGLTPSYDIIQIKQIKKPDRPSITSTEGDIQATFLTVKWIAPDYDGGSPITAYRVIILKGDTEIDNVNITDPGTTSYSFRGLERDTEYTVKVFAKNVVFEGPAAEKAMKTKYEGAPAVVEIDDPPSETTESTITLKWKKPDNNGKEITQYTVYQRIVTDGKQGEWTVLKNITDVSVLEWEVTLEGGKEYEFAITATNVRGESLKQDATKIKKVKAIKKQVVGGGPRTGDDNGMNTAVYAGAAAAGVLLIIGIVVIIVLWKRRKPSSHDNGETSADELGSGNPYEADDGYQSVSRADAVQSLQASGPGAEANYAQVDMSKKKKNRRPPSDEYAQVDKSKKTKKQPKKRPGELEYAELGDLRADLQLAPAPAGAAAAAAVVRPPAYEGTVYADIAQFGVPQPDPTYANVSKGDVVYSNLQSM